MLLCCVYNLPHDVELTNNVGDSSVGVEDSYTVCAPFAVCCVVLQKHVPATSSGSHVMSYLGINCCMRTGFAFTFPFGFAFCPFDWLVQKRNNIASVLPVHLIASSRLVLTSAWEMRALSLLSALT